MSRPNRKHKVTDWVVQAIAQMNYNKRIGRNPYNIRETMQKRHKHWGTLYKKDKVRDCMGNRVNYKPPF